MFKNRNSEESKTTVAETAVPKSVEELLPESKPTKKNLEALIDEIRSGKYAASASRRAEVLTRAGLMSTYLDMHEGRPMSVKQLRQLLVDKGIYEEEHSFWAAKNLWIALQTLGFITKDGEDFYLSKDFAPLYNRWKLLREAHESQIIEHEAEHKRILAEMKEKQAQEADATEDVKKQAKLARKEARQAAKDARVETYKAISVEKARLKAEAEAKKEALRAEKRMGKLDKKLSALREKGGE